MAEEKRVRHLWNCANELSAETHIERLLKSYYINTSRKLARHNIQLPEDSIGPARMCARCGSQWSDGNYKVHLKPQRLATNAKRRRLIAKLDALKVRQERGILSAGARKRAKWLKKRMASNVAVDCDLCGHQTRLPLEKPKKHAKTKTMEVSTATATTTTTATTVPAKSKQQKKHKNKDVNAAPKLPMPTQLQRKQPTATATTTKAAAAKQPKATATTTTETAPKAPAAQSNKQKKKQSKAAPTPAAQQKVQSKTQKQNALLQLAAQLKSHASQNAGKTQQNRLQAFLK